MDQRGHPYPGIITTLYTDTDVSKRWLFDGACWKIISNFKFFRRLFNDFVKHL